MCPSVEVRKMEDWLCCCIWGSRSEGGLVSTEYYLGMLETASLPSKAAPAVIEKSTQSAVPMYLAGLSLPG